MQTLEEKQQIISEIYQAYLERDISYLLGAQKEEAFTHLVRLLASQTGSVVNISELSSILGISAKTVKQYLWYLEKTFIVHKITPYFKNVRKELTKSPMYYFIDTGLRNYASGEFLRLTDSSPSVGFLFQNFVFNALKEKLLLGVLHLHFWRTKDGAEVDFVIDRVGEAIPIEVKYKKLKEPEFERSFRNFLSKYNPERAYIVNLTLEKEVAIGKTKVAFIPFHKLLCMSFD